VTFVLVLFVPTVVVLLAATCRALCEGWREHREWAAVREHDRVNDEFRNQRRVA
jgi:hypothetical protein